MRDYSLVNRNETERCLDRPEKRESQERLGCDTEIWRECVCDLAVAGKNGRKHDRSDGASLI